MCVVAGVGAPHCTGPGYNATGVEVLEMNHIPGHTCPAIEQHAANISSCLDMCKNNSRCGVVQYQYNATFGGGDCTMMLVGSYGSGIGYTPARASQAERYYELCAFRLSVEPAAPPAPPAPEAPAEPEGLQAAPPLLAPTALDEVGVEGAALHGSSGRLAGWGAAAWRRLRRRALGGVGGDDGSGGRGVAVVGVVAPEEDAHEGVAGHDAGRDEDEGRTEA